MRGAVESGSSHSHRVHALAALTACGGSDDCAHTAQLVLLAVLLKEVAGADRTMAAVAEALFAGVGGGTGWWVCALVLLMRRVGE